MYYLFFFFQAEDGIRDLVRSRGLGDVYKRQGLRIDDLYKANFIGLGVGAFYRIGPYAFPEASDNVALKLAVTVGF